MDEPVPAPKLARLTSQHRGRGSKVWTRAIEFGGVTPPTDEDTKLKELYSSWVDLHVATKRNLEDFESPNYVLPESAKGHEDVKKLVSSILNSVVDH